MDHPQPQTPPRGPTAPSHREGNFPVSFAPLSNDSDELPQVTPEGGSDASNPSEGIDEEDHLPILDFLWKDDHPDFPARSVSYHASRQVMSTPQSRVAAPGHTEGQTAEKQGRTIMRTLGNTTIAGPTFIEEEFNQVPLSRITRWVESSNSGYDSKKQHWVGIPAKPKSEAQLYNGIISMISSIMSEFVQPQCDRLKVERQVMDTHNQRLRHKEKASTSPDISIRAAGPSFQIPDDGKKIGYSNMASCIDVKLGDEISTKASRTQMSVYSQQIFAQQPNRWFVRCLLINENYAQLLHFDRGGNQITRFIPYHTRPALFIRLVIGITWARENVIGLDDSIQWKIVDGLKEKGTLKTRSPLGAMEVYDLVQPTPISHHIGICGTSTICWALRDRATRKEFLLKDSWSSEDRTPEWEHFEVAEGVIGLAEKVAQEGPRAEINQFRCKTTIGLDLFDNRKNMRLLFTWYGKHIDEFKSALQLLLALRDAIAGHARLLGKGIVHRNISNKNILLGNASEESRLADGYRGVLFDLGVAIDMTDCSANLTKGTLTGNRFFQSCMTLEYLTSSAIGPAPAHDYLDDLESFFNVLCRMLFLKRPDGEERPASDRARSIVKGWDSEDADEALQPKALLFDPKRLQGRFAAALVDESWGPECKKLFEDYRSWVLRIQEFKAGSCPDPPNSFDVPEEPKRFGSNMQSPFLPLYDKSREHYRDVVGYFNKAIGGLMQGTAPEMEAYEPTIPVPDATSIAQRLRDRKRRIEVTGTVPGSAPGTSLQDNRPKRSRTGLRSQPQ